jgi:hypothetical protein
MDKKSIRSTPSEDPDVFDVRAADERVLCPIHGQALELKTEAGKIIGVCRCNVPTDQWSGKTVYERASGQGVNDNG